MAGVLSRTLYFYLLFPILIISAGCATGLRERALYHINPKNYVKPVIDNTVKDPVFLVLAAATAVSFIEKDETQDWFSDNEFFTGPDGRNNGSNVRDVLTVGSIAALTVPQYLGAAYVDEGGIRRRNWGLVAEGAEVGVETFLWNRGLTSGLKAITNEERPDDSDNSSFPSGHASTSFAAATLIDRSLATEVDLNGWNPNWRLLSIFPYTAATYVGISRMEHDRHYLPDVLAGAMIGRMTANIIYDFHYDLPKEGTPRERREKMRKIQSYLLPLVTPDYIGIQYGTTF